MAEKRTGLGRGLDALLPGRQVSRPPSAISHQQNHNATAKDADGAKTNGSASASAHAAAAVDKDALAGAREISVDAIERNPYQTRGKIDEAALAELAASIREQGVLQPILVREIRSQSSVVSSQEDQNQTQGPAPYPNSKAVGGPVASREGRASQDDNVSRSASSSLANANSRYQLMAGERRWMAAQRAGLKVIPAVVKQASDEQAMEITIIENLQREDLNPMEQARAFERLSREFALTQEQIALKTGKERASVANFLRLLKLPVVVQQHIEADRLSLGHGKVLMMLIGEPAEMVERVSQKAAESGMSVRELEELVVKLLGTARGAKDDGPREAERKDPNVRAAEEMMQRALGCKVTVKDKAGRGKIVLEYASLEDFDRIVEVLGGK